MVCCPPSSCILFCFYYIQVLESQARVRLWNRWSEYSIWICKDSHSYMGLPWFLPITTLNQLCNHIERIINGPTLLFGYYSTTHWSLPTYCVTYSLRIIHENGFTRDECKQFRPVVYSNTIQSMAAIIKGMEILNIPFGDDNRKVFISKYK